MKILILGAGAIGGYYGARLLEGGADVTFLVRPTRARQLRANGLVVKSPLGDFSGPVKLVSVAEGRGFDLVLLACKTFQLAGAIEAVRPAVTETTAVMSALNGVEHIGRLAAAFTPERLLAAVCYTPVTLSEDGAVIHLDGNDRIRIGSVTNPSDATVPQFAEYLAGDHNVVEVSAHILRDLREKWLVGCLFTAVTCLMRGAPDEIRSASSGEWLIDAFTREFELVAAAIDRHARMPEMRVIAARLLGRGAKGTTSIFRDIERGVPQIEHEILGEFILHAAGVGVDVPLFRAAYVNLQTYVTRQRSRNTG